jgi:hypothetical protein
VKLLSTDTCLDAQLFLIARLQDMPQEKRLELTAAAIRAGMGLRQEEARVMDPFEIASLVTDFLERNDLEYFLGGSLASTVYGEPRFTQDVDIVVRIPEDQATKLVQELNSKFYISEMALREALIHGGSANLIHLETNFKIDLILSGETQFEQSEFRRRGRVSVGQRQFYFCSPEDIILAKLDWHRKSQGLLDRQLRDIQTVMMVQKNLDFQYLHLWAERLGVGEQLQKSLGDAGLRTSN